MPKPGVLAALNNMLMRYSQVSPDGTYTPPPAANAKASYSTMVYVRSTIVEEAGWHLAKATTIAVSSKLEQNLEVTRAGLSLQSTLDKQEAL